MYELEKVNGKFEEYRFRDKDSNSWFTIIPERGGIVTSLGFKGTELLYLDESTLLDESANVRGGNPVLFPICGQLIDGSYQYNGKVYHMKNHGVARTNPWSVAKVNTGGEDSITLVLESNESTKEEFPFDFRLEFTYRLTAHALVIEQTYTNLSDDAMPMYAGFHPYFRSTKSHLTFDTDASELLDYNTMETLPFAGDIDMSGRVESVVLLDAKKPEISFQLPDSNQTVHLQYGPEFRYIVVWTVVGKEFVCVEPWMAKTWALNTGEGLVEVAPGSSLKTHLSIGVRT